MTTLKVDRTRERIDRRKFHAKSQAGIAIGLHPAKGKGVDAQSERSDTVSAARSQQCVENTYQMSPDHTSQFYAFKVEKLLKEILETHLADVKYDSSHCSKLTQDLCATIKAKTKDLRFTRYKLVTQVIVGQDSDQSVHMVSRCLWNHHTDNFAAATFRNSTMYAIAIVYGVYLE